MFGGACLAVLGRRPAHSLEGIARVVVLARMDLGQPPLRLHLELKVDMRSRPVSSCSTVTPSLFAMWLSASCEGRRFRSLRATGRRRRISAQRRPLVKGHAVGAAFGCAGRGGLSRGKSTRIWTLQAVLG